MDPHGKPSQNGGGSFWSGGYGYDQSGQGGGGGGGVVGSGVIKGTGASEPVQPPTRPPTAPSTQTQPGTGVGPAGGGDNFPGAGSAVTPVDELSSSPGSLKEQLRKNLKPTIAYCSVFWMFGMCVAFLGPTLLDLGCQTASDMQQISWVFFAQLLCSLIGSTAAGFMSKRAEPNMILLVASTLIPLCMFIIPFCQVLGALGVVLAVMGFNMGCIDCLANLKMIQLYGEAVAPFLQGMHFCYGFGAFVSPMIAEPFLLNEDCTPFIDNVSDPTPPPGSWYENTTLPANTLEEAQEKTRVRFAFWIMAAVNLPIPLLLIHLLLRQQFTSAIPILNKGNYPPAENPVPAPAPAPASQTKIEAPGKNKSDYENIDQQKAKFMASTKPFWQQESQYQHYRVGKWFGTHTAQVIVITCLTASTVFIYDGLQSAYGGYVYTYAVKSIVDLNKTEGAYLNAVFWGTFALGRLMSIICATRFTPQFMLLCNICGCLLSMVLMLTLQHNHVALYFGTCFFGLFMSSVTPTALALAEQYIDVTSSITTFIVVVAALGEMLFPVIVGNLFVSVGPSSFLGFGNIACLASVFVFAGIWFFGRQTPKYKSQPSGGFIWCHMCCWRRPGGMPGDEDGLVTKHVKYYSRMSESDSNIELSQTGVDPQMAPQKMDGYGY